MAKGIVYVMRTQIDGLVKIGKCRSDRFVDRMDYIEREGYRRIGVLYRDFAIEVEDYDYKEKLLHTVFQKSRVGDTELFYVDIKLVKQLMASMEGKVVFPVDETKKEIFDDATEALESSILPPGKYTFDYQPQKSKEKYFGTLESKEGKLVLLKGSRLAPITMTKSKKWYNKRTEFILEKNVLTHDVEIDAVSEAAYYVCGKSKNGWDAWRDAHGNYIDVYRKQIETEEDE